MKILREDIARASRAILGCHPAESGRRIGRLLCREGMPGVRLITRAPLSPLIP